jgi:CcmD family protein
MSEWNFIAAAYGVAWFGLAGYACYLIARRRAAERALAAQFIDGGVS